MIFQIIDKLLNKYHYYENRSLFKKANCDISTLNIGAEVNTGFVIKFPEKLSIGDGTSISGNCLINALGNVKIGRSCHIAQGLVIYSHNHNFKSEESTPYDAANIFKETSIGDVVWIGANVCIAPGAKIGNGVIISMGSVVFGEVPDGAIMRGNPAQVVGYRDMKVFKKLYEEQKFF